jgi:hypothetical protein
MFSAHVKCVNPYDEDSLSEQERGERFLYSIQFRASKEKPLTDLKDFFCVKPIARPPIKVSHDTYLSLQGENTFPGLVGKC